MNKSTQIIVAVIVVVVIVAGSLTFYYTAYGNKSSNGNYVSTTSFSIADFGVAHPDAGAYAWMYSSSANQTMTLKKYDPNIQLQDFKGGSGAVANALTTKKVQMGMLSADGAVHAISQGVPIKIVSVYRNTPYGAFVYVAPNSNITNVTQLNNVTFANSKPGSLDVLIDGFLVSEYNLKNVSHSYVGGHKAQESAVLTGAANVSTGSYFDVYKLIQSGDLKSIGTIQERWPGFVIVALNSFISAHPNAVKAAIKGMDYGNTLFNQNKSGASYNFMMHYYNFSKPETGFFMHSMYFSQNGTIYTKALQAELSAMKNVGEVGNNTTLSMLYTNQFVSVNNGPFDYKDPQQPWKPSSQIAMQVLYTPEAMVRWE